jgi:hypothetical protein
MILPTNITRCMSESDQRAVMGATVNEAREKAIAKDERELQRDIANYLRLHGLWFTQSRMDRRASNTVGTPDFLLAYKGRFVAWECKVAWATKLRREQAEARDRITAQGGAWKLITTIADAQAHLREMDKQQPGEILK